MTVWPLITYGGAINVMLNVAALLLGVANFILLVTILRRTRGNGRRDLA